MLSEYSGIRIPTDVDDELFLPPFTSGALFPDGSASNSEGFYILLTGCLPNTTVMKIDYALTGEDFPLSTIIPISILDYA